MARNTDTDCLVPLSLVKKYLTPGTRIRIESRTATILEPVSDSRILVRYHDDGAHCSIHLSMITEVL